MPISFDGAGIGQVYAGGPIREVYAGDQLVWQNAPWPKRGSFGAGGPGGAAKVYTVAMFVVQEKGAYDLTLNVDFGSVIYGTAQILARGAHYESGYVNEGQTAVLDVKNVALDVGDVIEFRATDEYDGLWVSGGSWSVNLVGEGAVAQFLRLQTAKTSKYRVAFAGSSTMQGWNQPRYESVAHLLTARLLRHVQGANASRMISQTSGTLAGPTLPGFHFLNAALGGTTSLNYLDATKRNLVNSYGPDLLIHMVGSNDYIEQVNPDTYKTRMRSAINSIYSGTLHLLVHQQRREDRADTGYTWEQYGEKLRELADELTNVFFVDVTQKWHDLRGNATDWWAADKVHVTWKGAEGLATAIAHELELDEHIGETVWAFDPETLDGFGFGAAVPSLLPTGDSIVRAPATQSTAANQPTRSTMNGLSVLNLNHSGLRHLDTASWGAAYSFPMTFYVVIGFRSGVAANGTVVQPWFSRSVLNDDGWWWAWQDRGVPEVRAALNSAFSGTVNYGSDNYPLIVAVHMTANNRGTVWVNSLDPIGSLAPDRIDSNPGPWMKSLRIGANSTLASYTSGIFYEMRFEQAGLSMQSVQQRMRQLAEKYGVTLGGATPPGDAVDESGTHGEIVPPRNEWTVVATYTAPASNAVFVRANYEGTMSRAQYSSFPQARVVVGGSVIATGPEVEGGGTAVFVEADALVGAGQVLQFEVTAGGFSDNLRSIASGSWTVKSI